jgi:hypothetical protein
MQTTHAPWPIKRLGAKDLRCVLIEQFSDRPCWRAVNHVGSMLYFDFGNAIKLPSKRYGELEQGECTLSVRDCFWMVRIGGQTIIDSETVSSENAAGALAVFQGLRSTFVQMLLIYCFRPTLCLGWILLTST